MKLYNILRHLDLKHHTWKWKPSPYKKSLTFGEFCAFSGNTAFQGTVPTCTLTAFSVLQWELQILCHLAPCPIWLVQRFAFDLAWTKESLPKSDKSLDNNYSNIKTPGRKNKTWLREIPARDREILVTFNLYHSPFWVPLHICPLPGLTAEHFEDFVSQLRAHFLMLVRFLPLETQNYYKHLVCIRQCAKS